MRHLVTTTLLSLLALNGAALAADLPPPPPLPVEDVPLWAGFYAGLNVGGGFGSSRNAFNVAGFPLPSFETQLAGPVGGAEAGYNWQTGPWVVGLEASFEGSGLRGARTAPCLPPLCGALAASYTQKLTWFGTLRPKVGYAVGNWLLYATGGGAAWRNRRRCERHGRLLRRDRQSQPDPRAGWTLGAGAEVEIARGWSARVEYLHLDLGSGATTYLSYPPISNASRLEANVITAGVDYHF